MRSGVKSFTNLVGHNSLPDLLSVLAFKYDELAPLCSQAFENAEDSINESLSDQFADQGFVLDDQTGDVNEILDVEIQPYEPKLLRVDHNGEDDVVTCEFEIITNISGSWGQLCERYSRLLLPSGQRRRLTRCASNCSTRFAS
jgi:hypothetical protein